GAGRRIDRGAQERPDHDVGAARLVDHAAAEVVVVALEQAQSLGEAAAAEVRSAAEDHPGRLAAGVRVDHLHTAAAARVGGRSADRARRTRNPSASGSSCSITHWLKPTMLALPETSVTHAGRACSPLPSVTSSTALAVNTVPMMLSLRSSSP